LPGILPVLCLFGAWPRCQHDPAVHTQPKPKLPSSQALTGGVCMVGSPVRTRRARRLVTLLAMAVIVTALSGVAPAAAGGKPMPAGGKPMPLTSGQRSVAAANRQVADALAANPGSRRISPTSVLLARARP
jgi:hypothetical protein